MALGFAGAARLTVVVNTADDVELYGLLISPDLDTVMYTLAGRADPVAGWGLAGDTFAALTAMRDLGEDTWFTLGDRDLATHIVRTARRRAGASLTEVTHDLATALGVGARLLPMTDDPVATKLTTGAGVLDFQDYFVARRHRDAVTAVTFAGIEDARPAPGVLEALTGADVVVIAPSNPFVSVAPILAVPGLSAALAACRAPRVAISPIVGGAAIKGPAADMLAGLGHEVSALGVARLYAGLVDVMCIDERDRDLAAPIEALGLRVLVADTMMTDRSAGERLARELLTAVVDR